MKTDGENLVVLAALGIGAYVLYKTYGAASSAVSSVGSAVTSAGNAVGSSLFELLNPAYTPGTYYTVTFPDGSNHAVNAASVGGDGSFTWSDGNTYQLYVNNSITSGVNKTAVLVSD